MWSGSGPTTVAVWMRASGRRPSLAAASLVVTNTAALPSDSGDELPGVID
ncbi:hypothetical protein LAUMK41_01366 [Mycobacterium attenuatum]|uniref:Uncharacterized protein n=1 Tax=Mycobacterium attenuatum TaxID=2341086 RepID=A0A498PVF3_9MYCO|nr:hypothetical protein LAUMK136_01280 [Mycobacterium attenuatum]VBA54170.1 hypothetical protein LAUMK41_01366 [Mycobacterium attenuatum]